MSGRAEAIGEWSEVVRLLMNDEEGNAGRTGVCLWCSTIGLLL